MSKLNKTLLIFLLIGFVVCAGIFFAFRSPQDLADIPGSIGVSKGDPSAQEVTLDTLGYPSHFIIEYLPLSREAGEAFIRHEVWYYPALGKKVAFIGGNIAYTDRLEPSTLPANPTPLRPDDFDYAMGADEVSSILSESELIDFLPGLSDEEGIQTFVSRDAIFIIEDGAMVYLETLDPGVPQSSPQAQFSPARKNARAAFLLFTVAEAKNPIKQAFKCLKKICKFVVEAPEKITRPITRPLGPILGPIMSAVLTRNISKLSQIGAILRDARRVDSVIKSVEEQRRLVGELKRAYRDQSTELRRRATEIQKERSTLSERLIHGVISYNEYKQSVMDLDKVVLSLETAATKMERAEQRVNEGVLLRMLGSDVLRKIASQVEGVIAGSVQRELEKLTGVNVVMNLIAQGDRGADAILDLLISSELRGALATGDGGVDLEALKGNVRDGLKEMLKQNKADLRANWRQRLQELINKKKQELLKNLPPAPLVSIVGTKCEAKVEKAKGDQCDPGYTFQRMSGVGCVQATCNDIPGAHWSYEGYCVCGSSGSISENPNDTNKECYLPRACGYCPGCVFACVNFDEPCPALPK